MKLSLEWIQEFIDLSDLTLDQILFKINTSICETEEAVPFLPELETVIPVRIEKIENHPQADKLCVTQVNADSEIIQIVTNDRTLQVGNIVALALPGTIIGGKKIEESEVRGVKSSGMFCCGKDLGINEDESGVFVLNSNLPVNSIQGNRGNILSIHNKDLILGKSIRPQLGFEDVIIDIDNKSITHRPDLWSHFGFARELSAQFNIPLSFNPLDVRLADEMSDKISDTGISNIQVKITESAHAYYALPISSIRVSPSNMKFRSRLIKSGIKSISNVVDVSNYLLLECGQPTHFFDRNRLPGTEFEVGFAKSGETFPLLDETSPKLTEEVLLIRNSGEPVAIAGVMGGLESAVYETTTDLVLESAVFKREDIRKSIKKTGIRSDAAIRYEKGLDSWTCIPIIHRAIQLIKENGNPNCKLGVIVGFNHTQEKKVTIHTDLVFLQKKLGKVISMELVEDILNRLGFRYNRISEDKKNVSWEIEVPRYRHNYDVTIPEDLVEEIGRTIGYANIETQPLSLSLITPMENDLRNWEKKWKQNLALRLGFHEVFNYSFTSPQSARFENEWNDSDLVILENEMPEEHSVLRTSIYPSLIKNAVTNQDRFEDFGLFEIGRTYLNNKRDSDGLPNEERKIGILYLGKGRTQTETKSSMEKDFINLRTELEKILNSWGIHEWEWKPIQKTYFHPNAGLNLVSNGIELGEMGILHNRESDNCSLRKRPIIASINLLQFIKLKKDSKNRSRFRNPSTFPQGHLDVSLILGEDQSTKIYADRIKEKNIPELEEIWIHDSFAGGDLPPGKLSITYRVSLLPYEKTFTQERMKEITGILLSTAEENGFKIR